METLDVFLVDYSTRAIKQGEGARLEPAHGEGLPEPDAGESSTPKPRFIGPS